MKIPVHFLPLMENLGGKSDATIRVIIEERKKKQKRKRNRKLKIYSGKDEEDTEGAGGNRIYPR